MAISSQ
ncbi:hypothetical protein YPPY06_3211, partial [Yersinia pestis PY-06]